jgi:hypothetical protein
MPRRAKKDIPGALHYSKQSEGEGCVENFGRTGLINGRNSAASGIEHFKHYACDREFRKE